MGTGRVNWHIKGKRAYNYEHPEWILEISMSTQDSVKTYYLHAWFERFDLPHAHYHHHSTDKWEVITRAEGLLNA